MGNHPTKVNIMFVRFLSVLGLFTFFLSHTAIAEIKCWTNEDGVRECGSYIPPQYSQQGHKIFNEQGIAVKKVKRAKTAEEIAEEQRQENIQQEKELKRKEQEDQDRALLRQFSSEEDILFNCDNIIKTIDATIRNTNNHISRLDNNLNDLKENLFKVKENKSQALSKKEQEDAVKRAEKSIASIEDRIEKREQYLNSKQTQRQNEIKKYQTNIGKFREVKLGLTRLRVTAKYSKYGLGKKDDKNYQKRLEKRRQINQEQLSKLQLRIQELKQQDEYKLKQAKKREEECQDRLYSYLIEQTPQWESEIKNLLAVENGDNK